MAQGISFVICTRNGTPRLKATLDHLAAQRFRDEVPREIVLVDNASTDGTAETAQRFYTPDARMPLRVVHEARAGTRYARVRGLDEAAFDYVTYVDDDNWLVPDFGQIAFDVLASDRTIALAPARSQAVFESSKPPWFDARQSSFAVGDQFEREGDVSREYAHWWTAGLTLRVAAWRDLVAHGFTPKLVGRDGRTLGAGEDTEMCLAILLAGWRAHNDARLIFRHWMPADRMTWAYACRLTYQGQAPVPALHAYREVLAERFGTESRDSSHTGWVRGIAERLARAAWHGPRFVGEVARDRDLRQAFLRILSGLGNVDASLRFGARHDALLEELRTARWIGGGPARVARAATSGASGSAG